MKHLNRCVKVVKSITSPCQVPMAENYLYRAYKDELKSATDVMLVWEIFNRLIKILKDKEKEKC